MKLHLGALGIALSCLLAPVRAEALPVLQSASKTSDDASVTLVIPTQAIEGDQRTFCEISVEVSGDLVELTAGDTVNVEVFEWDLFYEAYTIYQNAFNVTVQEVQANLVQRTFDCSGSLARSGESSYEVSGYVSVSKSSCTLGTCFQDNATTPRMDVVARDDDGHETNNLRSEAQALPLGSSAGYVARDDDWYELVIDAPSRLLLEAVHRPESGTIMTSLRNDTDEILMDGALTDTGSVIQYQPLLPGTYALHIVPERADDFVFYGLEVTLESVSSECEAGQVDTVPCGNCGTRSRTCQGGFWGAFDACSDEGVCAPGDTSSSPCGSCGQRVDRCSDSCQWVAGGCTDDCAEGTAVLGEACRSAVNCVDGLSCLTEAEYPTFAGGYCSVTPCDAQTPCGAGGFCAEIFGRNFCLESCADDAECRVGYDCIEFPDGRACAPRCTEDADCGDPNAPVCNALSGRCEAGDPNAEGVPSGSGIGGSRDPDAGGVVVSDGGCRAAPVSLGLFLAGLAGLICRRRFRPSARA